MTSEISIKDDRYTIEARIGSGAMATVYRAYDQRLHRIVALKILHDHLGTNAELRMRFEQEAKLAARIDHPNVVRIYDIGSTAEGQLFIISEFIDGRSLTLATRSYTNRSHPYLDPILTALVTMEIARGMDAAHRHSVVHRDLKPDNVLVSQQGEVKLTDFGVARPFDSSMTQAGQFIGSLTYASPEQVHGEKIDSRSDIFSFGVILFELLTGQLPFRSTNPTDLAIKIKQAQVPPLNHIRNSIPLDLDSIVRKCLRADPAERPQSADQIVRELSAYLSRNEVQSSTSLVRDGFENPNLFSSTIRRSPLTHVTVEPEAPALQVETAEVPTSRPAPRPQNQMNNQVQESKGRVKPRNPKNVVPSLQTSKSHRAKGGWLLPILLISMFLLLTTVFIRERDEIQDLFARIREISAQKKGGFSQPVEPTPKGEGSLPNTGTPEPSASISHQTEPAKPVDTRTAQPERAVDHRPTSITPKPYPSVPASKRTAQPTQQKSKTQTVAKPAKETTKPRQGTTQTVSPGFDPKAKNNEIKKASLQIQTLPGPRTIDLIRGSKREFLGLSGSGNTMRVFSSLEPGLVTIYIPAEDVDGRKFEGFQKQLRLEAGKQLTLPVINSRLLTNAVIQCPVDVRISKLNGRRVTSRGGTFIAEVPLGSELEIEATAKSGTRANLKIDIRDEGQQIPCPIDLKKDR